MLEPHPGLDARDFLIGQPEIVPETVEDTALGVRDTTVLQDGLHRVTINVLPRVPRYCGVAWIPGSGPSVPPKGPFTLTDADGTEYDVAEKKTVALCRCGGSTTKPFCDGTHSRVGFEAAERAVAEAQD